MTVAIALFRKNLRDARWMLAILVVALFGLSWLFVHVAHKMEQAILKGSGARSMRMLRGLGGEAMDFSTTAIEMTFWKDPSILLMFAIWAIARGSGAVAGEMEKGSMDLILSRPVARTTFFGSQVATATFGLILMVAAMIAGNWVGTRYNTVDAAPSLSTLLRPGLNLVAFGFAIYGYTAMLSAGDIVRWRPNLIASVATLAMFIFQVISNIPQLEGWKWLEHITIFEAVNPVEAAVKGQTLAFNAGILGGVGLIGLIVGLAIFNWRDLPAGS
ncbi:ABC transporter permease subunit [Tundrisphaera sp. TA3]|uniref:ABC transporter permease subunit n=1 Tax=Tundrisphaera sp. TA3 TaxID=3435775 RepID=UPI003EB9CBAC